MEQCERENHFDLLVEIVEPSSYVQHMALV